MTEIPGETNRDLTHHDMTIGILSKSCGVNIETIRYYERIGILPAPPRSRGGYRLYDSDHQKRLGFVKRSRELGFSLDEIRILLQLVDGGGYSCAEVREITMRHRSDIQRKIADLRKMELVLSDMIAQCSGDIVPDCAIMDVLHMHVDHMNVLQHEGT